MAKITLVLVCIVVAVVAEPPVPQGQYPPSSQYGTPSGQLGLSAQYGVPGRFGGGRPDQQQGYSSGPNGNGFSASGFGGEENSEPANYEFKYDVDAPEYNVKFGQEEARQGDVAQGRYYVLLPDGRTQLVEYVADQDGYRPKISYEGGEGQEGYSSGGPNGQGGYSSGGPNGQGGYSNSGRNGQNSFGNSGFGSQSGYSGSGSSSQGGYSSGGFGSQNGYSGSGSSSQGGYSSGGPGGYSR